MCAAEGKGPRWTQPPFRAKSREAPPAAGKRATSPPPARWVHSPPSLTPARRRALRWGSAPYPGRGDRRGGAGGEAPGRGNQRRFAPSGAVDEPPDPRVACGTSSGTVDDVHSECVTYCVCLPLRSRRRPQHSGSPRTIAPCSTFSWPRRTAARALSCASPCAPMQQPKELQRSRSAHAARPRPQKGERPGSLTPSRSVPRHPTDQSQNNEERLEN